MIPLLYAREALKDAVLHFYNEMLGTGIKEMSARGWIDEFNSWLDDYAEEFGQANDGGRDG